MSLRFLLALLLCTLCSALSQETNGLLSTRPVSLNECIELALQRNLDLQIERFTAQIAAESLSGAYGAYSPLFSFGAKHEFVSDPGNFDARKFNPYFPSDIENTTLGPSLTGILPIGLSYDVAGFVRKDKAVTDFTSSPEDALFFPGGIRDTNSYSAETRLTLQQHLLKDFWIDSERQLILTRRKESRMSQQALEFQIMKTLLAVELGYFDLIAARESTKVQEKALELRRQLVSETQRRVQVGDLPPLDAEQAETQLQNTLTALAAAREAYIAQQNSLKSLLTDDFGGWVNVELEPREALHSEPVELNRSKSFQNAMLHRPDVNQARLAVERSDVMVKFRFNQLFPTLDLVGRYGALGTDVSSAGALDNALGFHNPEYFYGVVLTFPLDNLTDRANYRASKAAKQIAELQLHRAEQAVLVEVADLVNRAQSRLSQVGSTAKARSYAEAALAAEEKKLQNGFSTAFFVLQLQETLTAARTAELRALADYNKALAQLEFADGSILERHRLRLEEK